MIRALRALMGGRVGPRFVPTIILAESADPNPAVQVLDAPIGTRIVVAGHGVGLEVLCDIGDRYDIAFSQ